MYRPTSYKLVRNSFFPESGYYDGRYSQSDLRINSSDITGETPNNKAKNLVDGGSLKSSIHCQIRQIKDLDICPKKVYPFFYSHTIQSSGKLSA
jgi:hypothetical protein